MVFTVIAAILIVQTALGGIADQFIGGIALACLVLLLLSGASLAAHHYYVKVKHRPKPRLA